MRYIPLDGNKLVQHLQNDSGIAMLVYDRALTILEWNECMESCTGLQRTECVGKKVDDILQAAAIPIEGYKRALQGHSYALEVKLYPSGNSKRNSSSLHNMHFYPLEEQDQQIHCVMVLAAKMISPKRVQSGVRAAISNISDFLKYAPIPVFIVDGDLNLKLANEALYTFIERKKEKINNLREFVPSPALTDLQQHVDVVIKTGQPITLTEEYNTSRGAFYIFKVIFPVRNSEGKVDAVGGYLIDLTPQVSQQRQNKQLLEETLRLNKELSAQNQELQQKKQELDEANESLYLQKVELERVVQELSDRNYELDQIMYKTSHDLRAPLTSILGLLQLAKQETDATKIPEYHQYIENRVHKLDNFVKTMLTFAKSSRTELSLAPIQWEQLLQDSLDHVHYLDHFSKINVDICINADIYAFQSDPVRLNIILNNLIGNAIKYADLQKPAPSVQVRINNGVKGASIEVEDNGIGISQQYISKVCDMFFRATDRSEGSGLGLYIVKQTVERLNGKLSIDSRERAGTTISVFLPHLNKQLRLKTVRPIGQKNKKKV